MITKMAAATVALCCVLAAVVVTAPTAGARTDNTADRILFVHGYDPVGTPTSWCNQWFTMESMLSSLGFSGPKTTIGLYDAQSGCDLSVVGYGHPNTHHAPTGQTHDRDVALEHLGYELAWLIHDEFSAEGETVDVVAHSMGGLVVRYALAQVEHGHPDFPGHLQVDDVVTLGTPHGGAHYAGWCGSVQCRAMTPGSAFLSWLDDFGARPQVGEGTDWTAIGSESDAVVSASSAVAMDADHGVVYLEDSGISHVDYAISASRDAEAEVEHRHRGGSWTEWDDAPWVISWAGAALEHGSW